MEKKIVYFVATLWIIAFICSGKPVYSAESSEDAEEIIISSMYHAMPTTGDVVVPVFLVEFPDCKNDNSDITAEIVEENFFGEGDEKAYPYESLTNYYKRSSYGKLNLSGDVYDWYELSGNKDYYTNSYMILKEVMDAYDDSIDFSKYDLDGDGYIDGVYIMYAGEHDSWGEMYWSYMSSALTDMEYDGLKVNNYVFQHTEGYILTAIHETGHLLGLDDYYNYDESLDYLYEQGGMGYIDMMDHNIGDHNIFSKLLLGWVEPQFITKDSVVTLSAINSEDAKAVIVTPSEDEGIFSEYYIIELYNGDDNNANSFQCSDGAIKIYHIKADVTESIEDGTYDFIYSNTQPNTSEYKLIKLLESDGNETNGLYGWPICKESLYYEGMAFGVNTVPSSEFYGGIYTGINITIDELHKDEAKITVSFETKDKVAPEVTDVDYWHILKQVGNLSKYTINFNSYIYEGENFNNITCYEKDAPENKVELMYYISSPQVDGVLKCDNINDVSKITYNSLIIGSKERLKAGTEYVIEIPEGSICDAYGNNNLLIKESFTTITTAENETIDIDFYDVIPENIPDGYKYSGGRYIVPLSDGTLLYGSVAWNEDNPDKSWLVLRKYDINGNMLCECAEEYTGRYSWIEQVFELENGNIAVVTGLWYFIVSPECEILEKIAFEFPYDNANLWSVDRKNFFDVCNDRFNDDKIMCRIYKSDGRIEYLDLNDKSGVRLFTFDQYDSDYQKIVDVSSISDVYYNYCDNETSFWKDGENVLCSNIHDRYSESLQENYGEISDTLFFDICRWPTFTIELGMFSFVEAEHGVVLLDKNHYKMLEIACAKMPEWDSQNTFSVSNDEGYISIYSSYAAGDTMGNNGDGKYVVRWDKNYNVSWVSYVETKTTGIYCGYSNGYTVIASNDKIIKIADSNTPYISSDKSFEIETYTVDNETMTIIADGDITIESFKKNISGEYLELKFYDKNMHQVTDVTASLAGGLIEIADINGLYRWCYKIDGKSEEHMYSLKNAVVTLSENKFVYDGTAKYPDVKVTVDGTELVKGVDYICAFAYNVEVGTAQILIDSIGNYTDRCYVYFEIVQAPGLYKADDGAWYYYTDGEIDTSFTGMVYKENGWWYVINGKLNNDYTGLVKYELSWVYVNNGKLDTTYTGLVKYKSSWVYVRKGKLDAAYTGLVKYKSSWVYVNKGKLDTTYTGLVKYKSKWVYVKNGKLDTTYTGLVKYKSRWVYVNNGKLDATFTGMARNQYGWWYVTNGKIDFTYTGLARNKYGWWYMTDGALDLTYTGLADNPYGTWYIQKGSLNTSYTGEVNINGITYQIKNGQVK